ncbi:MAG: hypothetical protein WKF63_09985, partial [Thermomicrobiales bacterium]
MPNRKWLRSGFVWLLLLVVVSVLWFAFAGNRSDPPGVDFNTSVIADVKRGEVEKLIAKEGSSEVRVQYTDPTRDEAQSRIPPDSNIIEVLAGADVPADAVPIEVERASRWGAVIGILTFLLPLVLI